MSDLEERQRKVRFHSRVQFKTIRHVANFSDEEISAGWYCKKDFMRMSDEVSEIAKLVADGQEYYNGEELCTRGLEHLVEEDVADYRAEKMIASIDAVLDEQDEQMDENIYDPYMIADVYSEIVTPLLREAYLVGLRDAKDGAAAAALIPDITDDTPPSRPSSTSTSTGSAKTRPKKASNHEPPLVPDRFEAMSSHSRSSRADGDPTEEGEDGDSTNNSFRGEESSSGGSEVEISDVDVDDEQDGEEKLNTSLNSLSGEVAPDKVQSTTKTIVNEPDKKKMEEKRIENKKNKENKKEDLSKKLSAPASSGSGTLEDQTNTSSSNRTSRRKGIDRKSGTELSPFVFRRDGTVGFRNCDLEHKRREQSKLRRDTIKSSLFSMLEDDDDDEDFAAFIAKKDKEKPKTSKLYSMNSRTFGKAKKSTKTGK